MAKRGSEHVRPEPQEPDPDQLATATLMTSVFAGISFVVAVIIFSFAGTAALQLAKDGEICKEFGHVWEPEVVNFGTATFGNMARKKKGKPYFFCRICKARKVTKTVTEIMPAKEQK